MDSSENPYPRHYRNAWIVVSILAKLLYMQSDDMIEISAAVGDMVTLFNEVLTNDDDLAAIGKKFKVHLLQHLRDHL
jgi:hypothetical protein